MDVLQPALHGAVVGGFTGKGHPGGGFGAANDYYNAQRARNLQMAMISRQFLNDQFKNNLELARTQRLLNQPNFSGRGSAPIKGVDANGNPVFMGRNPQTGVYEPIPGITPEQNPDYNQVPTDKGIVLYDRRGKAGTLPLTLSGEESDQPASESASGSILPSEFNSGSPRVPGTQSSSPTASQSAIRAHGGVPLHPPNYGKPKPVVVGNRNVAGYETESILEENPDSQTFGQPIKSNIASRAPLPKSTDARSAKANDVARVEQYAAAALGKNGNDPDKAISYLNGLKIADPDASKDFYRLLPQIRKSITDRTKKRVPPKKGLFGMSQEDTNALFGNQNQPDEDEEE
jgi:hypothetical protein